MLDKQNINMFCISTISWNVLKLPDLIAALTLFDFYHCAKCSAWVCIAATIPWCTAWLELWTLLFTALVGCWISVSWQHLWLLVLTYDSAHSWWLYSVAPLGNHAMTLYPTQSQYLDIEWTSLCPILLMLHPSLLESHKYQFFKSSVWLNQISRRRSPCSMPTDWVTAPGKHELTLYILHQVIPDDRILEGLFLRHLLLIQLMAKLS